MFIHVFRTIYYNKFNSFPEGSFTSFVDHSMIVL